MAEETILIDVKVDTQNVAKELATAMQNVANLRKENDSLNKILKNSKDVFGDLKKAIDAGIVSQEKYGHLLNDHVNIEANLAEAIANNSSELETNNRLVKSKTALLQAAHIQTVSENETLDEQRQKLNTLQKAYASLTNEQKVNSATGLELAKQIKQVSDSVKAQESAIGDNRRNVGNYTESIEQAAKNMGWFGKSAQDAIGNVKMFGNSLKVLAKTPLLLILTGLVKTLTLFSDKLKESQEFTNIFRSTMAALGPLMDALNIALNKVVGALAKAFEWVTKLLQKIPGLGDAITEAIAIEQMAQQNEKQRIENIGKIAELERDISEYRKQAYDPKNNKDVRLANVRELIKAEKELADIKRKEAEDDLDYIKRRNVDTVTKRVNKDTGKAITTEEAQANPTIGLNNEELKEYEEARARMIKANVEYNNQIVAISRLEGKLLNQISKEEEEVAKRQEDNMKSLAESWSQAGEAWQEEYAERQKVQEQEYQSLLKDYEERKKVLEKYNVYQKDLLREQLETFEYIESEYLVNEEEVQNARNNLIQSKAKELTQLMQKEDAERFQKQYEAQLEMLANGEISQQEFIDNFVLMYNEALDTITQNTENATTEMLERIAEVLQEWGETAVETLSSVSEIMSNVEKKELREFKKSNQQKRDLLDQRLKAGLISQKQYNDQTENLDKELKDKEYQIELAEAKRAKAIAIMQIVINTATSIMKAFAELGPIGGAVMSAVIGTLSALQIAAVASEPLPEKGYATGGIVPGTSYSGDNVQANVNSGEMILNRQQQTELFNLANGGGAGNMEMLGTMFQEAVLNMPAPVLNYKEFTNFQKRTTQLREL